MADSEYRMAVPGTRPYRAGMIDESVYPYDHVESLVEQGRPDDAIAFLEDRVRGGHWEDLDRLSDLLVEHGRADDAEAVWQTAIDSGVAHAHHGLAYMLARWGRFDEAVAVGRVALAAGEPRARVDLAILLCKAERIEESIVEYRAAVAEGDVAAGAALAKMYARNDQFEEAVQAYRAAIGAEGVARWPLGAIFEKFGHVDEAVAAYRAAVEAGENHVRDRLTRLLAAHGRLAEATVVVQAQVAEAGHNPSYQQLGWLLTEQRRFAELKAAAVALKETNPIARAYLIKGAHQSANLHDESEEGSARVVRQLPGRWDKAAT
ncbi:Flp pilus assembly protein TadD [Asanoa ferruginea]|uniref:Flp pilus assembly protein TadD n=2 Tax=Asanoa ferruginea TaxID=53367 RepID=A0A3D9ZN86_9ACTN|nr:Flp pilus assembly protein TadD [Asanoa ferruginea]GIF49571.1 hypothetical protein Afe04nite_41100 [Asanoa ferruginea]